MLEPVAKTTSQNPLAWETWQKLGILSKSWVRVFQRNVYPHTFYDLNVPIRLPAHDLAHLEQHLEQSASDRFNPLGEQERPDPLKNVKVFSKTNLIPMNSNPFDDTSPTDSDHSPTPLYAIGDIHGEFDKWLGLLQQVGLINLEGSWIGGLSRLVLVGDYVDRGRQGLEVLRTVRRLQEEARHVGGKLIALLGNHDAIMIANARGRDGSFSALEYQNPTVLYEEIETNHYGNGGYRYEVEVLRKDRELLEWYAQLPLLHLEDGVLFAHGNIDYQQFGSTIGQVNKLFKMLCQSARGGMEAFILLTVRNWPVDGVSDYERPARYLYSPLEGIGLQLETFGGNTYVHGHTPENVTTRQPLNYAAGKAFNIDHALCYHPDLRGYVLEITPSQTIKYHVAKPPPQEVLSRLRERHSLEQVPLKRVLLRDQIREQEDNMHLEPSPISPADLFDLKQALAEIQNLQRVNSDPDMELTLSSLLEQLWHIQADWILQQLGQRS